MSIYQHAIVLIIADPHKVQAEAFGASLGHSGHEYRVPLSPDGREPATHWGLNTLATDAFARILAGEPPTEGHRAALESLLGRVTASIRPASRYQGHFADVLAEVGLSRVVVSLADPGT